MGINQDVLRRYTYERDGAFRDLLDEMISVYSLTPESHPKIADLGAGDGSISALFCERGWDQNQMTCIDLHESPTPLVPQARWHHLDLIQLSEQIVRGQIPPSAEILRAQFDIIAIIQTPLRSNDQERLCRFLAKSPQTFLFAGGWAFGFLANRRD